jgi:integrase
MSLFKRTGSPYWWTEFVVKGRRVVRSTRCTSRREAEAVERELRAQTAKEVGRPQISRELTVDQACGRYWIEHGRRLKDARNVQRWLRYVIQHIDPELPIAEISTRHVVSLIANLRELGRGEIAINRTVTCLQGVHNRAAKKWEEPVRAIDWTGLKTRERPRVRFLEQDEAQRFLAELPDHIRRLVLFILTTGLRKREAFGLTWDKVRTSSVLVVVKGGYEREVELAPEAAMVLAETPRTGRFVFDTTNWRKHFDGAQARAGITDFRWHDLRHTFATWLGRSGAPLEVVRSQLGHSSIAVTQKYRHVVSSEVRDSLQRLPTLSPSSGNVVPLKRRVSD